MRPDASLDAHPGARVAAACERLGSATVVSGCLELLRGGAVDDELVFALGGLPGRAVLAGSQRDDWLRVWALRALLYVFSDRAEPAVVAATLDPQWRVREMAAKVVARHRLDGAAAAMAGLLGDPVPRVRRAAERALIQLSPGAAGGEVS